jgi:hypothetical protein
MTRAGSEDKALILLVTFFPQCVVSMLSMTPPVMANQIAGSLGLSRTLCAIDAWSPMLASEMRVKNGWVVNQTGESTASHERTGAILRRFQNVGVICPYSTAGVSVRAPACP